METAKPPTTLLMLLLLMWTLLTGATVGSSLDKRELHMLEMMQNLFLESADLSGRSQRALPVMFASSVPCEDSLADDSSDQLSLFNEDLELDESEECGPFGQPCHASTPQNPDGLEPCPNPMVPMQHPCFVRVVLLRTPLMRQDPCTNFTLAMAQPDSSNTKKPRGKKCRPKMRKDAGNSSNDTEAILGAAQPTLPSTTEETTTEITTTPITTTPSTTTTTSTTGVPTTTTSESSEETTVPTLPTTTTTVVPRFSGVLSRRNQLKSTRGRRRRPNHKGVPDRPQIKLDGAMQSSDALPMFLTTEAAELRSRPEATTTPQNEATTDCEEASDDEEAKMESAASKPKASKEEESDSEDCEDTEDQDTNLCPQFSAPEEAAANLRSMPSGSRYRKPLKNYLEPILYEGQFAKPRQRIGILPPQQRDYYVSNKQIMPRPRPKMRESLPHSIYMNNIVRGIKCSDEAGAFGHPSHPGNPSRLTYPVHPAQRRLQARQPNSAQRDWSGRRNRPGYGSQGAQPARPGQQRGRGNPLYALSSAEDPDSFGHDSDQYYDDETSDNLPWPRDHPLHPSNSPAVDPCQPELARDVERARQRQRERERERERERDGVRDRDSEQLLEYPVRSAPNFFT